MSRGLLYLAKLALVLGLQGDQATLSAATVEVILKGQRFVLEVADTEESRAKGLMFRTDLCVQCGMLFVFEREGSHPFWMKNTPTSLDILFIDDRKRITGIVKRTTPYSEQSIGGEFTSRYVIELLAGSADRLGLKPGDRAGIPDPRSAGTAR